jgi:hypothetical protein
MLKYNPLKLGLSGNVGITEFMEEKLENYGRQISVLFFIF